MLWTFGSLALGVYFLVQAIRGVHPYGWSMWEKVEPGKPIRMLTRAYYAVLGIGFAVFGVIYLLKRK
jgi:hypothetical protein